MLFEVNELISRIEEDYKIWKTK